MRVRAWARRRGGHPRRDTPPEGSPPIAAVTAVGRAGGPPLLPPRCHLPLPLLPLAASAACRGDPARPRRPLQRSPHPAGPSNTLPRHPTLCPRALRPPLPLSPRAAVRDTVPLACLCVARRPRAARSQAASPWARTRASASTTATRTRKRSGVVRRKLLLSPPPCRWPPARSTPSFVLCREWVDPTVPVPVALAL